MLNQNVFSTLQQHAQKIQTYGSEVVLAIHGSRLYGTDTEDSDYDFIGVYMPHRNRLLAGLECPDVIQTTTSDSTKKNTAEDVDVKHYSFNYWCKLLENGDMQALELLFVLSHRRWSSDMGLTFTPYESVNAHRTRMLTKEIKLIDYVKKQVARYGFSQSRIANIQTALKTIQDEYDVVKLSGVEKIRLSDLPLNNVMSDEKFVHVDGSKFDLATTAETAIRQLTARLQSTSTSLQDAMNGVNVKWGDIAHAYRACCTIRSLDDSSASRMFDYTQAEKDTYLKIKRGELHFSNVMALIESAFSKSMALIERRNWVFREKGDFDFQKFTSDVAVCYYDKAYDDKLSVTKTGTEKYIEFMTPVLEEKQDETITENP